MAGIRHILASCMVALFGSALVSAGPADHHGLVVIIDCQDIPERFIGRKDLRVDGLVKDAARVHPLRQALLERHAADTISIRHYDGTSLPYIDNLVNSVIAPATSSVPERETLRVLAPLGRAYLGDKVVVKPWPEEIDDWTHFLNKADNHAVARDSVIGPPRHMQWLGDPLWARCHDKLASTSAVVTTRGRLYYIMDFGPIMNVQLDARWHLVAVDAFNGSLLWKTPMKSWANHLHPFRSGPVQIARLLVAHEDTVYTVLGLNEPVVAIDGRTGKTIKTYAGTNQAEEILHHQDRLIVVVNKGAVEHGGGQVARDAVASGGRDYIHKAVRALDVKSGRQLWRWPGTGFADIVPTTLAARGDRVFLQCALDTLALDLESGGELWRQKTFAPPASASPGEKSRKKTSPKEAGKKKGKSGEGGTGDDGGDEDDADEAGGGAGGATPKLRPIGWASNTLVAHQDVVLTTDGGSLVALSADHGKKLWDAPVATPFNRTPAVDVFVIHDIVWCSPHIDQGRDLRTGKIVKELHVMEGMQTTGHHHRCYRNRAAGNYIIYGHRGMEFYDTAGDDHSRNNWVRGECQYGIMPANGLLYAPPHDCGCYIEAMLHGFWALAPGQASRDIPADFEGRLLKGPAYDRKVPASSWEKDWPTYRQNIHRGGVAGTTLPSPLKEAWSVPIGGDLTAPVVAGDTVLLAGKKDKAVYALDTGSGKIRWHYMAGAPVDSPPTVTGGRVLFGSADGTVTCLTLDGGEVMWRFVAAPHPVMAMAHGEIESPWPVCGSVLVKNDIVYFTAGRSSYLDGGLFLFGLSVDTGEVVHQFNYHIDSPGPLENTTHREIQKNGPNTADYKTFLGADHSDSFSMAGNVNDVMVGDADSVYLRHMRFNDRLEPQKAWRNHLFSTGTLLDDNEAYRSHYIYGSGDFGLIPVSYGWLAKGSVPSIRPFVGGLLVHDTETLWGMARDRDRRGLVSLKIDAGQSDMKNYGSRKNREKIPYGYKTGIDFYARALIKAGPILYYGGAETVEGALGEVPGGLVQPVTAADGQPAGSPITLKASPVWEGMAAAHQALFVCLVDGSVVCLK